MSKTYTIKELSKICNCSIPTITKKIKKQGLKPVSIIQQGKKITAYAIADDVLTSLSASEVIKDNKDNFKTSDNKNYLEEYLKTYKELIEVKSNQKLLVDNLNNEKALYIKEVNSLTKENENLHQLLKQKEKVLNIFKIFITSLATLIITILLVYGFKI